MTTPYITELADGVYAYIQPDGSWYLNNTGFLTASNGVVSIDASSTERRTRAYLEAIRAVSDRPVRTLGYLGFVSELAREGLAAGRTPLEAAREADLGAYASLTDPERLVGNLHRAYHELNGAERGAPLDVMAAFRDMVTYNGGKPLTCHA